MATVPVPGYPRLVAYTHYGEDVVHLALAESPRALCGTNGTGVLFPVDGNWICGKCRATLKLIELWPVPLFGAIDRR